MGIELDARLALAEIEMKAGANHGGTRAPDRHRSGRQGQRLQPRRPQGCHRSRLTFPLKPRDKIRNRGLPNRFSRAACKSVPADQSATPGQECFVKVRAFFVAHAQPPELIQPSERPLHDPAPLAQSATVLCVALRKKRDDASFPQTLKHRKNKI